MGLEMNVFENRPRRLEGVGLSSRKIRRVNKGLDLSHRSDFYQQVVIRHGD